MEYHVDTQSQAWTTVVRDLLRAPIVAPRGLRVREAGERVTAVIARPGDAFVAAEGRKLNHAITAIEGTSLVGQVSVPELLLDRVGAFAPYANDGIFWGAYGPRAAGDVGEVVKLLKRDPDSRQAVITLFDSDRDLGRPDVKDVPCTLSIQFLLRDEYVPHVNPSAAPYSNVRKFLHMWVAMRSNDAWLGLPYDLGQFSLLQSAVAQALGARIGTYTHSVGSMHLYERDWAAAELIGEPVGVPVVQTWGSADIAEIASRARRILMGEIPRSNGVTELEAWLLSNIHRASVAQRLAR